MDLDIVLFCFTFDFSPFVNNDFEINLQKKKQNKWNLKCIQDYVIISVADER